MNVRATVMKQFSRFWRWSVALRSQFCSQFWLNWSTICSTISTLEIMSSRDDQVVVVTMPSSHDWTVVEVAFFAHIAETVSIINVSRCVASATMMWINITLSFRVCVCVDDATCTADVCVHIIYRPIFRVSIINPVIFWKILIRTRIACDRNKMGFDVQFLIWRHDDCNFIQQPCRHCSICQYDGQLTTGFNLTRVFNLTVPCQTGMPWPANLTSCHCGTPLTPP